VAWALKRSRTALGCCHSNQDLPCGMAPERPPAVLGCCHSTTVRSLVPIVCFERDGVPLHGGVGPIRLLSDLDVDGAACHGAFERLEYGPLQVKVFDRDHDEVTTMVLRPSITDLCLRHIRESQRLRVPLSVLFQTRSNVGANGKEGIAPSGEGRVRV
jgi:hypothetical protein